MLRKTETSILSQFLEAGTSGLIIFQMIKNPVSENNRVVLLLISGRIDQCDISLLQAGSDVVLKFFAQIRTIEFLTIGIGKLAVADFLMMKCLPEFF